jgi:hypothetical protein
VVLAAEVGVLALPVLERVLLVRLVKDMQVATVHLTMMPAEVAAAEVVLAQ